MQNALSYCEQRELFSANDLRDTLEYFREAQPLPVLKDVELPIKYSVVRAQARPVDTYIDAMMGGENP